MSKINIGKLKLISKIVSKKDKCVVALGLTSRKKQEFACLLSQKIQVQRRYLLHFNLRIREIYHSYVKGEDRTSK